MSEVGALPFLDSSAGASVVAPYLEKSLDMVEEDATSGVDSFAMVFGPLFLLYSAAGTNMWKTLMPLPMCPGDGGLRLRHAHKNFGRDRDQADQRRCYAQGEWCAGVYITQQFARRGNSSFRFCNGPDDVIVLVKFAWGALTELAGWS